MITLIDFQTIFFYFNFARFSHESVGEGEDRHIVLERCPESSVYVNTKWNSTKANPFLFLLIIDKMEKKIGRLIFPVNMDCRPSILVSDILEQYDDEESRANSYEKSQAEELASLVKDNLVSKHLLISVEEKMIKFIDSDTKYRSVFHYLFPNL